MTTNPSMHALSRSNPDNRDWLVDATKSKRSRLMRALSRVASEGLMVFEHGRGATHVSRSAERVVGVARSRMLGSGFESLLVPEDRGVLRAVLDRFDDVDDPPERFDLRLGKPEPRTLAATASVEPLNPGQLGVMVTLRDVTGEREETARRERETEWFRAMTDHCADLVMVLQRRRDQRYEHRFVSAASQAILGISPQELAETDDSFLVHPEDVQAHRDAVRTCAAAPGNVASVEFRARHADGRWVHLESKLVNRLDDAVAPSIVATVRDISSRAKREAALQARIQWFADVTGRASDIYYVVGPAGEVLFASQSVETMLGWKPEEIDRDVAASIVHERDHAAFAAAFQDALAEPGEPVRVRYRARTRDGRELRLESVLTDCRADPAVGGTIVTTRDVTERELQHPATGLPSRRRLLDVLEDRWAVGGDLCLVAIEDLATETLARAHGDEAAAAHVQAVGERLRRRHIGEVVGHLAERRLAVLASTGATGELAAKAITQALQEPVAGPNAPLHPNPRLAIVCRGEGLDSPTAILNAASSGLDRGRADARNLVWHSDREGARARERLQQERVARRVVETGAFEVHYQPIVRSGDGTVAGFEALIRPSIGDLNPGELVRVAQETGLISELGRAVLRRAVRAARAFRQVSPDVSVSVNASAIELLDATLVQRVASTLKVLAVPPSALRLELTETALVDRPEATRQTIVALRALGVGVSLDDFGTGYSSLSHLHRFPIDGVKIDRSFTAELGRPGPARAVVGAVAALGRDLGLSVVAEGVETEAQAQRVVDAGVGLIQGYLYAKALPEEAALGFLTERG